MRSAFVCLWTVALSCAVAAANPGYIDPDYCDVWPQDLMTSPRIVGIPTSGSNVGYAEIHIVIRNIGGMPLPNLHVELFVPPTCSGFCLCPQGVEGYTNAQGEVTLVARLGSCCHGPGAAVLLAEGQQFRSYEWLVSPDHDGAGGDCSVNLADFTYFSSALATSTAGCADLTGDDVTGIGDFVVFGTAWGKACR